MILTYSGKSEPSARKIAEAAGGNVSLHRGFRGDVNWGRNLANTTLNSTISKTTNKRKMRELFKVHGVPTPKLYEIDEAYVALTKGTWIVGRPDRHERGRGFWLCKTVGHMRRALEGTSTKQRATHFMEYIPKERAPHEYRVHIFLGRSIRISEKLFDGGSYTTIRPTGEIKHVRRAAKEAVEAVGLDFGAVDVLANDTEAWVLEVNAAPGLGGSMPHVYADAFTKWSNGEWNE